MLDEVLAGLDFFKPKAVTRYPGATDGQIAAAEQAVGCRFPPSMRAFLLLHDGALLPYLRVYGVASRDESHQIVSNTFDWRERTGEDYVIIASDASGDEFALLTAEVGPNGEYPIAMLDHETSYPMGVVASTYERFLWFALDDMKRSFRKDGEYRAAEVYGPWPFSDQEWMLRHDPDLKRWLKLYEPPEPVPAVPEMTVSEPERTWPPIWDDKPYARRPDELVLLPNGELLVATRGLETASAALWNPIGGTLLRQLGNIELGLCAVTATPENGVYFAGTPRGRAGTSVSPESRPDWNTLWLADWETNRVLGAVEGQSSVCYRADWEPDGRRIAATYADGTVLIFDLAPQRIQHTMRHPTRAAAVCFSPDGALLASSGQLNEKLNSRAEVVIWCTVTGERLKRLDLEPEGVGQLVFSPDSSTLAISRYLPQDRGQIDLWDLRTGRVKQLAGHGSFELAFTSDGKGLLATHDAQVRLWDTETGALKVEFGHPAPASVSISSMVLLPDDRRFIVGKSTRVAEVWAIPETH